MNLVVGGTGLLGSELCKLPDCIASRIRLEQDEFRFQWKYDCAFLCAGTKGFAENEGNRASFRSDVDGNIRLARHLLKQGTFVVFVSTDSVEWALNTAYARNRFMVEMAIGGLPNVAIFRPSKFDQSNVLQAAQACAKVGLERIEGLTRWPN